MGNRVRVKEVSISAGSLDDRENPGRTRSQKDIDDRVELQFHVPDIASYHPRSPSSYHVIKLTPTRVNYHPRFNTNSLLPPLTFSQHPVNTILMNHTTHIHCPRSIDPPQHRNRMVITHLLTIHDPLGPH